MPVCSASSSRSHLSDPANCDHRPGYCQESVTSDSRQVDPDSGACPSRPWSGQALGTENEDERSHA